MRTGNPESGLDYYAAAPRIREGTNNERTADVLLEGREGSVDNFKLIYQTDGGGPEWSIPRHHHTFDQIRFMMEGGYTVAQDKELPPGWVGYFPESVYYGPQLFNKKRAELSLQFGGPTGLGYFSVEQRKEGIDRLLKKGGSFDNGMYVWEDKDGKRHNQDSYEAVWQELNGEALKYPETRYSDFILMNPDNFNYLKDPNNPGVSTKALGTFTEKELKVGFVHLDEGASTELGHEDSTELMFLNRGRIFANGESHGRLSAFGTFGDEPPATLRAEEESELLYVKLPTFS